MARARCFPPSLLDDPDYFELDGDTQAILIGLVPCADDHGRCLAHTNWLARKLNREASAIETALATLEANHMIQRYQVEQQHYCLLLKWRIWQAGLKRPARPLYPAPPSLSRSSGEKSSSPTLSEKVGESPTKSDKVGESHLEVEDEEEIERESESEREDEDEGEQHPPANVVTFPISPCDSDDEQKNTNTPEHDLLQQIARILHLSPDEALLRVVQDYRAIPDLSLRGEADLARAWINDPRHNKKRKHMSPTFFRNWLKRECNNRKLQEAAARSQQLSPPESRSALRAQSGTRAVGFSGAGLASQNLMDLEQRYKEASRTSRDSPSGNIPQSRREGGQV